MINLQEFTKIYPNFSSCVIQTFDDNKHRRNLSLARIFKSINDIALKDLQSKWAWVFFSVNSMDWERWISHLTKINTWICEMDNYTKEEQMEKIKNCPLPPNLIIESDKSYHLYWFSKDWTKEKWYGITRWICKYFDWDPKIIDISRVLRLPWYYHLKDEANPFMVNVIHYEDAYFTEEQMIWAYWLVEEVKKENVIKCTEDSIWEELTSWDTMSMINDLSWTRLVNWDDIRFKRNTNWTQQIVVNWQSTSCWIDTNWLIWSNDKWWPTWVQWIMWYNNVTKSELLSFIREKYNSKLLRFETNKIKEVKPQEPEDIFKQDDSYLSWGLSSIDNKLGMIWKRDLVVLAWYPSVWKTEFVYSLARQGSMTHKIVYFSLELPEIEMKKRLCLAKQWISKIDFQLGKITPEQKDKLNEYYKYLWMFNGLKIINYEKRPTVDVLMEKMKELIEEWVEFFIIDNLGNIAWWDNENDRLTKITNELQGFKNNYSVWIILLHHLSKPWKWESYKPWWISKVRSSQKIIDNATLVLEIFRDLDPDISDEEERAKVTLFQYKDTFGGVNASIDFKFEDWEYKNLTN